MKKKGFVYIPQVFWDDPVGDNLNPLDQKYAERFGYHLPSLGPPPDPNQDHRASFADALDGCAVPALSEAFDFSLEYFAQSDALLSDLLTSISGFEISAEGTRLITSWSD